MARAASAFDFEQGGMYSFYERFPYFATRADMIRGRYAATSRVLIAGCGWGYLVDELFARGISTYGCDLSSYAINKGKSILPNVSNRLFVGDCRSKASMDSVRTASGLTVSTNANRNQTFDVIVTEDMLGVMDSEAEVQQVLTTLRGQGKTLFHIITCIAHPDDTAGRDPTLLWRTHDQWKAIIGNGELVMNVEGGEVR